MRDGVPTTPEPLVERSEFWMLEMVSALVDAFDEKKFVVEIAVDEAYGKLDAVFPVALKLDAVGVDVAETTPLAFVARSAEATLEMVRFEVEAVVEYAVPVVNDVEDAYVMVAFVAVMVAKVCVPAQVFEVVVPYATEKMPVPELYCSG